MRTYRYSIGIVKPGCVSGRRASLAALLIKSDRAMRQAGIPASQMEETASRLRLMTNHRKGDVL